MRIRTLAGICAWSGLLAAGAAFGADQPVVPPLARTLGLVEAASEVDANGVWETTVALPALDPQEAPVLYLHAFAQAGGGCNYVLRVLINGVPLTETPFRRRLLNKLPWFDPPGTEYHFAWYDSPRQRWMTIFGQREPLDWGGTGRDTEFIYDLTGLVQPGEQVRIGFAHAMPELPAAIKRDRAPLVISQAQLGALSVAEVDRLRRAVEETDTMKAVPVQAELPADVRPEQPPYEVVWSGRNEQPPAQVACGDLQGWTALVSGEAQVSVQASAEKLIWRPRTARVSYSGSGSTATILLRPPRPIMLAEPFDAANLWVYGGFDRNKSPQPQVVAYVEDASGRDVSLDLGPVTNSYWCLLHGVLNRELLSALRLPARFTGLALTVGPATSPGALHLESLAFYRQNRKPFVANTRPKPPAFPVSDDGLLPTPPPGTRAEVQPQGRGALFISTAADGVLRFAVEPEKGLFAGISVQWQGGSRFQPMAGGEVLVESADGPGELVSTSLRNGKLLARWRRGVEYQATYWVRGRSLVVDVEASGGQATGLSFGRVAGLAGARAIEVPYLTFGYSQGPAIACGNGLFASVLPDWYHCRCSLVNGAVPPAAEGEIGLMAGTSYLPLTRGRRNDLHDRVLVTVSPDFAQVLPNIPNPPAPTRERFAPYLFVMASTLQPNLWTTMKRHGLDHVISCDFAGINVQDYAEGFSARWRPHPSLAMQQVQEYRRHLKDLGYLFGVYADFNDWFPLNEFFDEDCISLTSQGDLVEAWYGNYRTKPNYLPILTRLVGARIEQHYPPDIVYMDTHTCYGPQAADHEAGVWGAGIGRDQVYANGDCILEARKWYGSVISEGAVRWIYAGLADIDYASLFMSQPAADQSPLVDFDLLKIHPLNLGTMMGYSPSVFFRDDAPRLSALYSDTGRSPAPQEFYQYVSASLAYGHMLMLGYGYLPPLSRMIHLYALMQGVQTRYLADRVLEISYHDGQAFLPTSRALQTDATRRRRVRVRYAGGLTVRVNYHPTEKWTVDGYELPPYGWLITGQDGLLAFSALLDGRRVDYVRCPEYLYLNSGGRPAQVQGLEANGAVLLKKERGAWRLIPCGDLGPWEYYPAVGLPPFHRDMRLQAVPPTRGVSALALGTQALLGKSPDEVTVTALDEAGHSVEAQGKATAGRLVMTPTGEVVDYLLR